MADVGFDDDDDDDAGIADGDGGYEEGFGRCPEDDFNPLQKLEKYLLCDNIFNRQQAARNLLDTARWAQENEDIHRVFKCMMQLAEDAEATVRAELMEQVPHIAMYCQENREILYINISTYLLPIVVRYLNDINSQVRKTSQAALLVLLEQDLVESADLDEKVCPVVLELASPDSIDDFRTEAVAMMSKMAPLVGRDVTVRLFLPRFSELCTDAFFHVRKVCASNFGDMCTVVGQEYTESQLLPKFHYLCEDGVWGVRKACAECFMPVSYACSPGTRRIKLSPLFLGLVCDQSRWVRMAAFQNLGGFISTFADPGETGLYFNDEGVLVAGDPEDFFQSNNPEQEAADEMLKKDIEETDKLLHDAPIDSCPLAFPEPMEIENSLEESQNDTNIVCSNKDKSVEEIRASEHIQGKSINAISCKLNGDVNDTVNNEQQTLEVCDTSSNNNSEISKKLNEQQSSSSKGDISDEAFKSSNDSGVDLNSPPSCDTEECHTVNSSVDVTKSSHTDSDFSTFHYWRTPLPDIDVDIDIDNSKEAVIDYSDSVATTESNNESSADSDSTSLDDVTSKLSDLRLSSSHETEKSSSNAQSPTGTTIKSDVNITCDAPKKDVSNTSIGVCDTKNEKDLSVFDFNEDDPTDADDIRLHIASLAEDTEDTEEVEHIGSTHVIGQHLNESTMTVVDGIVKALGGPNLSYPEDENKHDSSTEELFTETICGSQKVIPAALLEHYLSMTDPSRAQTVDTEITKHCAFSLPAVAYTLGRQNWPCLKELYETLAADMQWKVRRTLAFSLHELAVIVGDQITHKDLVPIFNGFTKDLDEVRVGLLKHLAEFLKLLNTEVRQEYLTKIPEFLNADNSRNWRFREELAEQMLVMLDLFSPRDIANHLVPIAMVLAEDKVSIVRQAAFRVLSGMLKRLSAYSDEALVSAFVNDIIQRFAESNKWTKRQMFAQICQQVLADEAISQERFAKELLPSLIRMGEDSVPNVRISLAKTLAQNIVPTEYFTNYKNPHHEDLLSTVQKMQSDQDKDVRYFITQPPETEVADMVLLTKEEAIRYHYY